MSVTNLTNAGGYPGGGDCECDNGCADCRKYDDYDDDADDAADDESISSSVLCVARSVDVGRPYKVDRSTAVHRH